MSAEGDKVVFQNSVESNSEPVLFEDKNYTYITDSTSNSGSFSSGQIQFDLQSLNSQSQWVNLSEAVIEFPVKVTAQLLTPAAGGTVTNGSAGILSTIIKNGWHSFIDSCQLIINGQTVQSSQPYENVSAAFRILSSWSQDTNRKWASSTGIALDDCTSNTSTTLSSSVGFNNALASTVSTSSRGLDVVNNQNIFNNLGVSTRAQYFNSSTPSSVTSLQGTILGNSNIKLSGKANVAVVSSTNTANTYMYSAFAMATVRLRDICDISELPMTKNLKGYIYLTFNSTQINLTGSSSAATPTIAGVSYIPLTGRSCPILINDASVTGALNMPYSSTNTTQSIVQVIAGVDATTTGAIGGSGPVLTNARLVVPYYIANPKTDSLLTKTQYFSTLEKIVNPFTVSAGSPTNTTLTVGVPNPRRLVLIPMYQNLGGTTNLGNPEISAFDTVPQTSSPFAYLQNLQVYCANKPLFQYPIQYDFEMWNSEISQVGANGNLVNEMSSGLLSQQLWEQNHRFYTIDLSRRLESEDGASKSIQVSFNNPSSAYGMKVIAIIFYEKKWKIETATCNLSSA